MFEVALYGNGKVEVVKFNCCSVHGDVKANEDKAEGMKTNTLQLNFRMKQHFVP